MSRRSSPPAPRSDREVSSAGRLSGPGLESNAPATQSVLLAIAWIAGFNFYFYSLGLPNNGLSRTTVWEALFDHFLFFLPEESATSGWKFLPQRFPLVAVAGAILLTAWSAGGLLLRVLRVDAEPRSAERQVFAFGLGLSAVSLATLGAGLAGLLHRPLVAGAMGAVVLLELSLKVRDRRQRPPLQIRWPALLERPSATIVLRFVCCAWIACFLAAIVLGGMLPETDFDVKEYHLEGPKEFFQAKRVEFLPHNVYTSFPFGTEMLSLLAMVLRNDWFWGGLAGKATLMAFGPLTSLAVYATAKRCFGEDAGWLAASIHLSTPWTYRISTIAYAEGGLTFFLIATLLAVVRTLQDASRNERPGRAWLLPGALAGSAMACKYPGVLSVVIPLGLVLVGRSNAVAIAESPRPDRLRIALIFAAGTLFAVGPWLLKNLVETGNPVYPLLYSVFGGVDWDPALNARWKRAHSPADFDVTRLWFWLTDVSARNDWLSPLLYAFAPLAWFRRDRLRIVAGLWLYVAFLFGTWWLLTHRLDRFWVPMLPVVAVLAGGGASALPGLVWKFAATAVIAAAFAFNLGMVTSGLSGYNAYLVDLNYSWKWTAGFTAPAIAEVDERIAAGRLPAETKVLCVGEAQVFDATFPLVYNTVFDASIFQEWCAEPEPGVPGGELKLRDADSIRKTLKEHGITHVLVNWAEILRYRTTYGYADFVAPRRFAALRDLGVLGEPFVGHAGQLEYLPPAARTEIDTWGPELKTSVISRRGPVPGWKEWELYPVLSE